MTEAIGNQSIESLETLINYHGTHYWPRIIYTLIASSVTAVVLLLFILHNDEGESRAIDALSFVINVSQNLVI